MPLRHIFWILVLLTIPVVATNGRAEIEYNLQRQLKTDSPPIDIAVSESGRQIFILTETGKILVYAPDGKLQDTIDVGRHIDQIETGPREDLLIVKSRKNRTVDILVLDFIHKINTLNSPSKGPANAPVQIVVFTDFQ